ncbi:MAG: UDP-N-acetylmuramate--L-alanine ligase [Rhodothermales bacterium]|nr:UDP-N-acetylmuramate--L-alanine ligase [Rhodothermales bacterium]
MKHEITSKNPGLHRRQPFLGRIRRVHMVGIGGIGMSSIAEVLINRGYAVTGSDMKKSDITDHLETLGATIFEGHAAGQAEGADVVVYSSAVRPADNPETQEADRLRIPLISRAVMLGELMRMKFGIGIAGTHGKTTTTTMTGLVVAEAGFDPTIIVGGKVASFGSNAVAGEGDIIVIEADEYDRTFLRLTPSLAVVTNIDTDHLDIYEDLADIQNAFVTFTNSVPFFGAAILCLDDPKVQEIVGRIDRRIVTYGTARQAHIRAEAIRQQGLENQFDVYRGKERLGAIVIKAPGLHNVQNALAAIAVGLELDIPFDKIASGLAHFTGVQRRFQLLGEAAGILVVDDYAHHPTEVRATLRAASAGWPDRRIVAVFQPHLYSRTRDCMDDFARAFFDADVLVLTEIYGAREAPIPGIDGRIVADLAAAYGHRDVYFEPNIEALPALLRGIIRAGDVVITMGAGNIWRYGRRLFEELGS